MYTATLDGQQLPDDVDVRIDGWPRVDYLSRSVQSGKASLTFTSRGWADDYRGQACEVRRDHDDLLIMRGVVSSQSVAVGLSSSIVTLSVESGERRVKRSWPTDHLEDDGRFPLNVSGVVQRVFGSVESVPLPEVRTGFRLVARNPIYGDPNNIGTIDVYEGDVLVAEDRPIQRIEDGLGEVYSVIEVDYRKLNVSVVPIAGETTIEFGVEIDEGAIHAVAVYRDGVELSQGAFPPLLDEFSVNDELDGVTLGLAADGAAVFNVHVPVELLDGKTLRSGQVIGNLPGRGSTDTIALRDVVEYVDDLIGGGWSLSARVLPEEIAKLPVGMLITDRFNDVADGMLDRLGAQYGFTADVAGGWSIGPELFGVVKRVPGVLTKREFIHQGLVGNVRVEWGTSNGDAVGAYQMPDDHSYVRAFADRELPTHEVRAVDVPSVDVAGVVARRMMVLNGKHRERWTIELPIGHDVQVGDALDLSQIDRLPSGYTGRGLVETVRPGAAQDEVGVLV